MKHAGADSLARLAPLLARLRRLGSLTERKPGSFYLRSSAFLHFHEDRLGLFADVKLDGIAFTRLPLNSAKERKALLELTSKSLARPTQQRRGRV